MRDEPFEELLTPPLVRVDDDHHHGAAARAGRRVPGIRWRRGRGSRSRRRGIERLVVRRFVLWVRMKAGCGGVEAWWWVGGIGSRARRSLGVRRGGGRGSRDLGGWTWRAFLGEGCW